MPTAPDADPAAIGAALLAGLAGRGASMARQALERAAAQAAAEAAAGREAGAATRASTLALAMRSMRDRHSDTDARRMLALRCLGLGEALASREADAVAPHELAAALAALGRSDPALRDALASTLPARRRPAPPPDTLPTVVPFACPWRDGRRAWRFGRGLCTLADTPPDQVDATLALGTPAGRMDAVLVAGTWHRPLLAPGSWEPATLETFAEAAGDGRAWSDNPFVPWSVPDRVQAPLASVTLPGRQARREDGRRAAEGEADALARAGRLRMIGGIVHRPSTEPMVILAIPRDAREALPAFAWAMDRIHSGSSMGTLDPSGPRWDVRGVPVSSPGRVARLALAFGHARLGDAAVACAAMAAAGMAAPGLPVDVDGDGGHDPAACLAEAAAILGGQARLDGAPLAAALGSDPSGPAFAGAVRDAVAAMPAVRGAPGDIAQAFAGALALAALEGLAVERRPAAAEAAAMGSFVP